MEQLTHIYKNKTPYYNRKYILTLTSFMGKIYATIKQENLTTNGNLQHDGNSYVIQNKVVPNVPENFDAFIKGYI